MLFFRNSKKKCYERVVVFETRQNDDTQNRGRRDTMNILVMESSTANAKAMLYHTEDGTYEVKTEAYQSKYEDVSILDAEDSFQQTMKVGRELAAGRKIDIIALGGTWHSVVLCDKNMKPQTPLSQWSNTSAKGLCEQLRRDKDYANDFYQRTGCMVNTTYPVFRMKKMQQDGYNLKDYLFCGQGTYNMYRLTGERILTASMASGAGILNVRQLVLDPGVMEELGVSTEQFGRMVDYNQTFPLSEEGAKILGMEPGIPVIPPGPDGGMNQVGAGAIKDGVMTFSVGTSGAIRLTTPAPVLPDHPSTWCYVSPKTWLSGAATSGCCNCVDWIKKKMFDPHVTYKEIECDLKGETDTPVFLPFLFGERCPGWQDEREGGFFDVRPVHGRKEMYQAVLEGVLFNLYQCYEALTALNGVPHTIKLSGGILHSAFWKQMCADIFGADMQVDDTEHGSMLGGVALGLQHLGILKDAADFQMSSGQKVTYDPAAHEMYLKKYQRYLYWYEKAK